MSPITIEVHGNLLRLHQDGKPLPTLVLQQMTDQLSYIYKEYTPQTYANRGLPAFDVIPRRLFDFDQYGLLITPRGFFARIEKILAEHRLRWTVEDAEATRNEKLYVPDWDRLRKEFRFRPRQEEAVASIFAAHGGLIEAPPGFGKMWLIAMTTVGLDRCRVDITTRRTAVVHSLHKELRRYIPASQLGMVGAGSCKFGDRVTIFTADSLHKSDGRADVLLVDEAHEMLNDRYSARLSRYRKARRYAFSASPEGRLDGCDLRMEALFGPTIFQMSYPEAVALELVVPIQVKWLAVHGMNPCAAGDDDITRKRKGIWRHHTRNRIIADEVANYPDAQVLILCDTVDHLVHLRSLLPDFTPVYADCDQEEIDGYIRSGMIQDWPRLNRKKRDQLKLDFEHGKLRKVMATRVWSVGVSFNHLEVLVRADGGMGKHDGTQMPGRVSRINTAIGKEYGLVIDLMDYFDSNMLKRSRERWRHYASEKLQWTNIPPS